ncbi:MAG: cobyrinic acid a,c-diamide synthase, partial [Pseudobutyrivibrio sp.]|nr:cobyrinic acid a,c-diamide synthase [Pseudobutyrivibrio sp.]
AVADNLVMYEKVGVVVNRVPSEDVLQYMDLGEIPLLGWISSDTNLMERDLKGESVFYIPREAPIVEGLRGALNKMEIIV